MTYESIQFQKDRNENERDLSYKDGEHSGRWKRYYMTRGKSNFWDNVDEWNQ